MQRSLRRFPDGLRHSPFVGGQPPIHMPFDSQIHFQNLIPDALQGAGTSRASSTETIASLIGTSQSIHDYPPILTELQLLHADGLEHISAGEQTALKDTLPRSQTDETHGRQCYPGHPDLRHIIGLRRGNVSRLRLLRRRGFTPDFGLRPLFLERRNHIEHDRDAEFRTGLVLFSFAGPVRADFFLCGQNPGCGNESQGNPNHY